jgi:hypothetical protein
LQNVIVEPEELDASVLFERNIWERHGLLPGAEHVLLYLNSVPPPTLTDSDLVFLWISCAFIATASEDQASIESQLALEELTERLSVVAVGSIESRLDELGTRYLDRLRDVVLAGAFTLEDGTILELERGVLADGRRILVGRIYRPGEPGLEVVLVAGNACQIRTFPNDSPRLARSPMQ